MSLHAENRARLCARLVGSGCASGVVVLQGGASETRHETDHEILFRQESFFHWTFGVKEPDCLGCVDVATGRATLFIPRLPAAYAVVMGAIKPPSWFVGTYGVDAVHYLEELPAVLKALGAGGGGGAPLLLLHGFNTDNKAHSKPASFEGMAEFECDTSARLWDAMTECRVIKTPKEQALLRYSSLITSEAHLAVMQHCAAGMSEYQLESTFNHWCYYYGGCRHSSYTCICASGHNGSILHYGHAGEPNAKVIKAGDLCLFDMGTEYTCYGSDVTSTFPVSGTFTPDQRLVYTAVFDAWLAVMDAMKPGVVWLDMQTLAYRILLARLTQGGLLTGELEAQMAVNLGATFMPHGLGHMLGIDTHDVGGYPSGGAQRPTLPGYASLRTTRALQQGMFLTVEPGCYFIDHLLDAALADPARACFLVPATLARFRGFGGVRLEDDVLVTEDGCENFTHCPRTVEDIEAVLAGTITQRSQLKKFH